MRCLFNFLTCVLILVAPGAAPAADDKPGAEKKPEAKASPEEQKKSDIPTNLPPAAEPPAEP